jgi:hypothetical protein
MACNQTDSFTLLGMTLIYLQLHTSHIVGYKNRTLKVYGRKLSWHRTALLQEGGSREKLLKSSVIIGCFETGIQTRGVGVVAITKGRAISTSVGKAGDLRPAEDCITLLWRRQTALVFWGPFNTPWPRPLFFDLTGMVRTPGSQPCCDAIKPLHLIQRC